MSITKYVTPVLLTLLLASGWAWYYAIPKYQEHQEKQKLAAFFAADTGR